MAITTIDGIIAGLQPPQEFQKNGISFSQGRIYSYFNNNGRPSSGESISSGLAGNTLSGQSIGMIPFANPVSGNTYLAKFAASCSVAGTIILYDRLWHNSGIVVTSTGVQTINSPQFPARDLTGGTSGCSVLIGVEVQRLMGAGTPTFTMNYTGNDGLTATTTTAAQPTAMLQGTFVQIPLASGHTGVQKVNWWQQSATMTSGNYSLVAYRTIARCDVPSASIGNSLDVIQLGMPRLYNNSNLFLLFVSSTSTAPNISGQIIYTQG